MIQNVGDTLERWVFNVESTDAGSTENQDENQVKLRKYVFY